MEDLNSYISSKQPNLLNKLLTESPELINSKDDDDRTVLMNALSNSQDPEVVSVVLKHMKSANADINSRDKAGFAALHIASSLNTEFLNQLLPFKPEIDIKTNNKQTPLFLAVSKEKIDNVEILIKNGAKTTLKDIRGVTALQRAAAIGNQTIVELLVNNGAFINATDGNGWSALHFAYAEHHKDVAKYLIEKGADPNLQNKEGERPIDMV